MSNQPNASSLNLSGLSDLCQRESELFFQRLSFDPQYCFELFRRAFVEVSQAAWECIYQQYRLLILSWIERHPLFFSLEEEADYFINRAFEKMWAVVTPQKFSEFPDLRSLLRYLQLCVHSVMVDYSRLREQVALLGEDEEPVNLAFAGPPEQDDGLEGYVARRQHSRAVWELLEQRLKTRQEQVAAYATFVLDLKPRQTLEEFPGVFGSITEIYTIKENVLDRLRRDEELLQLLTGLDHSQRNLPGRQKYRKSGPSPR